jgi:hypothetical protein
MWGDPLRNVTTKSIELDDGKIYRKARYLMVKTMVSCSDFPNKTNPVKNPSNMRS